MNQPPKLIRPLRQQQQQMIVTSCEEETDNTDQGSVQDSLDDDNDNDETQKQLLTDDLLFDNEADDEDEAYVYKHLRSGVMEEITVLRHNSDGLAPSTSNVDATATSTIRTDGLLSSVKRKQQKQKLQALKPRHSDAVLSCPYCFYIVCMDCQRHEYYKNQYRAMFVMNIAVRWDMPLQYDTINRCLIPYVVSTTTADISNPTSTATSTNLISDCCENDVSNQYANEIHKSNDIVDHLEKCNEKVGHDDNHTTTITIYYTVCCANCQTTVAALDMTEEVYYFSDCLVSS
jgi:hypothetical protein